MLKQKLPYDHPVIDFYDCLLKRQRLSKPDLKRKDAAEILIELLDDLDAFDKLLNKIKPEYIILSHSSSQNINYGVIVTIANKYKIKIIRISGFNGSLRFFKFQNYFDTFDCLGGLNITHFKKLNHIKRKQLCEIGKKHIISRITGQSNDIASKMAFKFDKKANKSLYSKIGLIKKNWDLSKPIISVYAQVWIDNPHVFGLNNFNDSYDWILFTFNNAKKIRNVNWIFRPHPWEKIHGRPFLKELLNDQEFDHINILDHGINGKDVIDVSNGFITISGTAGIECTSVGKPVILADIGWYHKSGFGLWAKSKKEYQKLLHSNWWEIKVSEKQKTNANIFAGAYFGKQNSKQNLLLYGRFLSSKDLDVF